MCAFGKRVENSWNEISHLSIAWKLFPNSLKSLLLKVTFFIYVLFTNLICIYASMFLFLKNKTPTNCCFYPCPDKSCILKNTFLYNEKIKHANRMDTMVQIQVHMISFLSINILLQHSPISSTPHELPKQMMHQGRCVEKLFSVHDISNTSRVKIRKRTITSQVWTIFSSPLGDLRAKLIWDEAWDHR